MPRFLRVVKHAEHQHYKNRNPPWIKLHRSCLDSYRFTQLSDAGRWHALGIALLASQTDNHVPADAAWLKSALHSTTKPDIESLIVSGFVEYCGTGAGCTQCASDPLELEEERRGREEKSREETEQPLSPSGANGSGAVDRVWEGYIRGREIYFDHKNGRKPSSEPSLTPDRRKEISKAIKVYGEDKSYAAGRGIFLSDFHTGKNDEEKEYLQAHLPWRTNKDGDNIERFAELYFEAKDRRSQ